ncbi:MAG: FAD synthase [Thaumarchaeota archaeon]|nr:FAD synthase [Nitrososphaerota archaeon]
MSLSKNLLVAVYCDNLQNRPSALKSILERTHATKDLLIAECKNLAKQGHLKSTPKGYYITGKGRKKIKIVFAGGAFDIIHPGHVHTLSESKKLGDALIVSVARNSTVIKNKGRKPVNDEKLRKELVQALRCVDLAILGSETNIFETVMKVKPNIIALGYDQMHDEKLLVDESAKRGIKVKVVRLSSPIPNVKSSKIIKEQSVMKDF